MSQVSLLPSSLFAVFMRKIPDVVPDTTRAPPSVMPDVEFALAGALNGSEPSPEVAELVLI